MLLKLSQPSGSASLIGCNLPIQGLDLLADLAEVIIISGHSNGGDSLPASLMRGVPAGWYWLRPARSNVQGVSGKCPLKVPLSVGDVDPRIG